MRVPAKHRQMGGRVESRLSRRRCGRSLSTPGRGRAQRSHIDAGGGIPAVFLKVGWIADLIADPVLKGFVEDAIWVTILKQLAALLGREVNLSSGLGLAKLGMVVQALPQAHLTTTLVAVASVTAPWLLRSFARKLPGPLVVPAGSTFMRAPAVRCYWALGPIAQRPGSAKTAGPCRIVRISPCCAS